MATDPPLNVALAEIYLFEGDFDRALQVVTRVLGTPTERSSHKQYETRTASIFLMCSRIHLARKDYTAAQRILTDLYEKAIYSPRDFGLACHLGLLLDLPTLGCAKTRLIGTHREPGPRRGHYARLVDRGERIGTVLRTRSGVKPVFVSPGHRIGHEAARRLTLSLCRGVRLPEPIRAAHAESNRARRDFRPGGREVSPC